CCARQGPITEYLERDRTLFNVVDRHPLQNLGADARIRTADPFITREGRVRNARPRAGTRGHVFAAN
ncbi:MAG: hypothetical protein M3Q92_14145, partial [Actinomycetota bacterium]|nr:hypothetical protein [Actinomycetota bacterium]